MVDGVMHRTFLHRYFVTKCTKNHIDKCTTVMYNDNMETQNNISRRKNLYGYEFRDRDNRRSDDRKVYQIKQLWQRSHEIINLSAQGWKNNDIADILGITPETVSATLNSDLGEIKLSEIRMERDEEAKKNVEKIRVLTNKALSVYHSVFDDESGNVSIKDKMKVADTVLLELSGLRAPTKIQTQSVSTVLTAEEIKEFRDRGRDTAKSVGIEINPITEGKKE